MLEISTFKNKHKGETIHVFGAGPSLNYYAKNQNWNNLVTIGVNGTPFVISPLTYWLRVDPLKDNECEKLQLEYLKSKTKTIKMLPEYHAQAEFADVTFKHSNIYPCADLKTAGLYYWGSSVMACMDFAAHCGAERVVVWGLDYKNQEHAYKDAQPRAPWDLIKLEDKFQKLLEAWPAVKFFNANPLTGLKCIPIIEPIKALAAPTKQKPDTIAVLTCTGDRHECLQLTRKYFERSLIPENCELNWVVVDDGNTKFNPGGCVYCENGTATTFAKQLKTGLKKCLDFGATHILFMEDDDWYHPGRICAQVEAIQNNYGILLHGYKNSIYYNVPQKRWQRCQNTKHSSLHDTAVTREIAEKFLKSLDGRSSEICFDMLLWKDFGDYGKLDENCGMVVSLKGMPGRHGLGNGHDSFENWTGDNLGLELDKLIGEEDARAVRAIAKPVLIALAAGAVVASSASAPAKINRRKSHAVHCA